MSVRLAADDARVIREHAREAYPHECCGFLLGRFDEDVRIVAGLARADNARADSPRNRYSIAPKDFLRVERAARERGHEVVGFYHSHPDHPARPSEFDREHAWPVYAYLIVSVHAGEPGELTAWRLAPDRTGFHAEVLESPEPNPARAVDEAAPPNDARVPRPAPSSKETRWQ